MPQEGSILLQFSIELPLLHGLNHGLIEQHLGYAWVFHRHPAYGHFVGTSRRAGGGRLELTVTIHEEAEAVARYLEKYSGHAVAYWKEYEDSHAYLPSGQRDEDTRQATG